MQHGFVDKGTDPSPRIALEAQHALLFQIAEQFENEVAQRDSSGKVAEFLEQLLIYMAVHFAMEERLMLATEFPEFRSHRQEHESALAELRRLDEEFSAGREAAVKEAVRFVKCWKEAHVRGTDIAFDAWLDQAAQRSGPVAQ